MWMRSLVSALARWVVALKDLRRSLLGRVCFCRGFPLRVIEPWIVCLSGLRLLEVDRLVLLF
jgi:hypothetical protein